MAERKRGPDSPIPPQVEAPASEERELRDSDRPTNRPVAVKEKREKMEGELEVGAISLEKTPGNDENEDALLNKTSLDRRAGLYAAADGIGGAEGGEVASAMTVEIIEKYFPEMEKVRAKREAGDETATIESEAALLRRAIREANARIILAREEMPVYHRMGTTCVSARVTRDAEGNAFGIIASAGDSRAYIHHPDGRLETLTVDDCLPLISVAKKYDEAAALRVQEVLDNALGRGQLEMLMTDVQRGHEVPSTMPFTTEDIQFFIDHMEPWMFEYYYKRQGEVLGAVGNMPDVKVKIIPLPPGSQIILATDGLDGLTKQELELIVNKKFDQLPYAGVKQAVSFWEDDIAQALAFAGKERQEERRAPRIHPRSRGIDDTTVVVISVPTGPKR